MWSLQCEVSHSPSNSFQSCRLLLFLAATCCAVMPLAIACCTDSLVS